MKKKILFIALISILSLLFITSKQTAAEEVTATSLVTEYFNNGEYTKKTQIYLSEEARNDYAQHFHVNARNALDRTTYYKPGYLLMGDLEGGFDEINSGFRNDGNNVKHFVYKNETIKDDYSIKNTSLKDYFVVLDDMIGEENFFGGFVGESETKYTYTVSKVESGVETKLHEFLWFTAPGLNDSIFTSDASGNYFTQEGITLVLEEKNHVFYGDYLSFRIILDPTDIGKVKSEEEIADYNGEELVLSEARVYKGLKSFDENDYYSTFNTKFENNYIYRLGNVNTVKLGSLFTVDIPVKEDAVVNVNVEALEGSNVTAVATQNASNWENTTLKFSGTGLAKITISTCEANKFDLIVEVVNATNVTTYSELKNQNSVLLNDITMNDGVTYYLSGATLYGNGFTFDMSKGAYKAGGNVSSSYVFNINNAKIDNTIIVGAVYTQYGAQASNDYNRAAILSTGNNVIENSYVSNCASAIRIKDGKLEIVNSTIKGGNFANIDVRGGNIVLDNVTTINQVNGNDLSTDGKVVVGLGVVVYYENVLETTTIEIRNGITQYNNLSQSQAKKYITDTTANTLTSAMYSSSYSSVQYNDGSDTWVNTGILSMTSNVGDNNITDVEGYLDENPSMTGVTGYLHTAKPNANSVIASVPTYVSTEQGFIAPTYSFDHSINNLDKTEGSNDYCVVDNGVVNVSMDEGDSFEWNTNILNVSKNGNVLPYTVSMNEVDYTGKNISFDTAGEYEIIYTYIDSNNYSLDEEGNIIKINKTYTKVINVTVAVIEASAKRAEFTFGSNNQATEIINIGNNSYISAVGVTVNNSSWTSMTINGQTIYYPIIDAKLTSTKGLSSYAYFPVFENAITITDYAEGGKGDSFTYNKSTTSLPSTLAAVKGYYAEASKVTWSSLTEGNLNQSGPNKIFKWASSSDAPTAPTTYNSVLCFKSPEISADRSEYITLVQYSYTDATNTTYYYYIGYKLAAFKKSSICLAPDTLILLANGTQKEIQCLTMKDEVVAWNFYEGKYETMPISLLQTHETGNMNVLYLNFEDGTVLKVLGEHGIYDTILNTFIFIDEDDVNDYVGHSFVKKDGESFTTVKLTSYEVKEEYTTAYTILSGQHYNVIAEGMFTVTPAHVGDNFFNPFEVNEDMKYDKAKVAADIEKYGLYTYEDFAHVLTYEQFEAINLAPFKVSVAKGYITYEGLIYLIESFVNNNDYNIQ